MEALATLPSEELHVQHGPASAPPCAAAYPFLPFTTLADLMQSADVVVSHAGVGSIMCAVQAGHVPIVFPRLKRYRETVDDHQLELATALAAKGAVLMARTPEELVHAVRSVPARGSATTPHVERLHAAVRAAIYGERSCVPPAQVR